MKNKTSVLKIFVLAATLASTSATVQSFAATPNTSVSKETPAADDNRLNRRFGAYLGILGDPHPTNIGVNVAYNVSKLIRASVGFGKVSASAVSISGDGSSVSIGESDASMTTFGAAAKFLMPGWNLSPAVTVGYSHVSISDNMIVTDEYKSDNLYVGLGGDWQAASGFNLGAGLNLSLNGAAPTAPYINVGMFF